MHKGNNGWGVVKVAGGGGGGRALRGTKVKYVKPMQGILRSQSVSLIRAQYV